MRWQLVFVLLLALPFACGLELYDIECYNDGHVEFTVSAENESKAYTKDIAVFSGNELVEGSWGDTIFMEKSSIANRKYGTFTSKEGVFTKKEVYNIKVDYAITMNATTKYNQSLSFQANCPGLLFTCSKLNLSIQDCYNQDNKFKAIMKIQGLSQSNDAKMDPAKVVSYTISASNIYQGINNFNSKEGGLPLNYNISSLSNEEYLLEFGFEGNSVNKLFVELNEEMFIACSRDKYSQVKYYDSKECSSKPAEEKPVVEEKPAESQEPAIVQEETQEQAAPEKPAENEAKEENQTIDSTTKEDLNAKDIILFTVIVLVIGLVLIYWLKRRDITPNDKS